MPEALAHAGLSHQLQPVLTQRIEAPPYGASSSLTSEGIRNAVAIRSYAESLAQGIDEALSEGYFPVVVGGDCSILIGSMLALRRKGTYGLLFIDGHTDFYLPEQSSTGGAAGMDLALVTGWGPDLLTNIDGLRPYVAAHHVIALANRDEVSRRAAPIPHARDAGFHFRSLQDMRAEGVSHAVRTGLASLGPEVEGVWIHLDLDALHHDIMPAVDSPQPDGLTYEELTLLFDVVLSDPRLLGVQLTIYDPDLDLHGAIASMFVSKFTNILLQQGWAE